MDKKEKFGAWKKTTSKGEVIEFTINGQKYSMWKNKYKTQEKQPDYTILNDYKPTAEQKKEYNNINKQEAEPGDLSF